MNINVSPEVAQALRDNSIYDEVVLPDTSYEATKDVATQHDLPPEMVVFGSGLCPDEIKGDLKAPFVAGYNSNREFDLCRVDGILRGNKMVSAYSHHAPDGGGFVVLNAPHVGINSNGEFGKIMRDGQKVDTACCGAGMSYLEEYTEGNMGDPGLYRVLSAPGSFDISEDYDTYVLKKLLHPHMENITKSDIPQLALTQTLYDLIAEDFHKRVSGILSKKGPVLYVSGIEYDVQTVDGGVANLFAPEKVTFYKNNYNPLNVRDEFLEVLEGNESDASLCVEN